MADCHLCYFIDTPFRGAYSYSTLRVAQLNQSFMVILFFLKINNPTKVSAPLSISSSKPNL